MHDTETMRSAQGLTSSLVTYFVNGSLNENLSLTACMEAIAEKVNSIALLAFAFTDYAVLIDYARMRARTQYSGISTSPSPGSFQGIAAPFSRYNSSN